MLVNYTISKSCECDLKVKITKGHQGSVIFVKVTLRPRSPKVTRGQSYLGHQRTSDATQVMQVNYPISKSCQGHLKVKVTRVQSYFGHQMSRDAAQAMQVKDTISKGFVIFRLPEVMRYHVTGHPDEGHNQQVLSGSSKGQDHQASVICRSPDSVQVI